MDIPTFLERLAQRVDIGSGTRYFVNETTLEELRRLRMMPWHEHPAHPWMLVDAWLVNSRVIVPDQELPNEFDVRVRHSDVLRASECAELATFGAQILALEPKPEYSEEDDLRRSWAAWDFIAKHSPKGSQYERERDRGDLFDPEPLEGSFPPINDGNQEALRQLTQEP